ncbi:glycosyltransferase [Haladaptatus halobius]|uniref:glycosyltransferase n=1 Tax=Haladaptatus halobius TaxID=2884875 RepID=UPI001D09C190|nr:hypothetical protein [Haladaptatus halobius]
MSLTIAIVHYCEGAGHATRMLAIADALEAAGVTVHIAGGGAGAHFVDLNGYDAYEPTTVDFIGDYQDRTTSALVSGSVVDSTRRISELVDWLRDIDPDAVVTDDMFAAMAAVRVRVPQYVIKHDLPDDYENRIERFGARFHCSFQSAAARTFFYPAVWEPSSADSKKAIHVPPLALEGSDNNVPGDLDVVVVPSHYSDLDAVAERLAARGKTVANVGSEEWEPVPALLPYLRAADVVVCSGYSTVMEAAVAGTPCVVLPATSEQEGVARRLHDLRGFTVVDDVDAAVAAAKTPFPPPEYENGASVIAEDVLADLRSRRRPTRSSDRKLTRRGVLRGAVAVGTAVAGTTAVSAADGRKSYHFRSVRSADRSVGRADAAAALQQYRERYGGEWPTELRDLNNDRFDGATSDVTHLNELFKRTTGRATVRAMQVTFALDNDTADYRHWLWLGVDTTDANVRTGVLRRRPTELGSRHVRISFAPSAGRVERVHVATATETTTNSFTAFLPGETPPNHPAGKPPEGAASLVWRGGDARLVSLLGMCETSMPESTDWTGSQWQFVGDFRPKLS